MGDGGVGVGGVGDGGVGVGFPPPPPPQPKWAGIGSTLLSQTVFWIQSYASETREYTPGKAASAHPIPHETTPTCTSSPLSLVPTSGPPESPCDVYEKGM